MINNRFGADKYSNSLVYMPTRSQKYKGKYLKKMPSE